MRAATRWTAAAVAALGLLAAPAPADPADTQELKAHIVDVGTGLGVYLEFPTKPGERPVRVVYDTGKGQSEGTDNDMVSFLTSPEIGLRPADGDFEGDIIDYFVLSHPHEDHFNGGKPIFDLFDVRNVIESKQLFSYRYLKRFKAPAVAEIYDAKAAGKDAHYYVVGLPYPNGFDQPVDGKPYDEYAICQKNLPAFLADQIDCAAHRGKVRFPFTAAEVAQPVQWPMVELMGPEDKGHKFFREDLHDKVLEVDAIPIGTQFRFGRHGGFTVVHGDHVAAFDGMQHDRQTYAEAFPYYSIADLNDASVSIQVVYKRASILIPGDTEGRTKKPSEMVRLTDVFGTGQGDEAYTAAEVSAYLRRDKPAAEQLPLLPEFERYLLDARDILQLGFRSYVTFDEITPKAFKTQVDGNEVTIPARGWTSPEDIDDSVISWDQRSATQRATHHKDWRRRLFKFFEDLSLNKQKWTGLKSRFNGWNRGLKPRLVHAGEGFDLDWENPVYTITNLVQLAERVYYVDPGLANLFAGFIMRSKLFLDYLAPPDKKDWAKRGEKHMIAVADQIEQESGIDVLDSDVLVFGHHGSFTSSSLGFVLRVDPNVGIISADDKSYAGSTLPDFSALFWNMNSHHPDARKILHSLFFHADLLARKRGEPIDDYTERNRYSAGAAKVFRARRRWPIPIWRTDFNDDLENVNVLMDNIALVTDGEREIWDWARHRKKGQKGAGVDAIPDDADPTEYQYWAQQLISQHPPGSPVIRPVDPSGVIKTYQVGHRLPMLEALERARVAPEPEDDADFEAEDWTAEEHFH